MSGPLDMEEARRLAPDSPMRVRHVPPPKGPLRLLCDEIGFAWDPRLERPDLLVAFVDELVEEVRQARWLQAKIADKFGKPPSEGSAEVLALTEAMLRADTIPGLIKGAKAVHEASWRLNPEGAHPTDHLIDMLASCASAIRFGLGDGIPCASRHAADAASHVWRRTYGVSRFDSLTPEWERSWARSLLSRAIVGLMRPTPPALAQTAPAPPQDQRVG